ncbi:hypothetical protein EDB19DRAFT_1766093, partial [Suillus lakei]
HIVSPKINRTRFHWKAQSPHPHTKTHPPISIKNDLNSKTFRHPRVFRDLQTPQTTSSPSHPCRSFFYLSHNYHFIPKTIQHAEYKFILRIIRQYWEHV